MNPATLIVLPIVGAAAAAFGPARCMMESNFPVDKGMCSYPVMWNSFKRIAAADFKAGADGHGDVSVTLTEDNRIAWLQLWPHCRAWHLKQPQPTLRCIADAEKLGRLLSQAWSEERGLSATPNAAASSTALPITGQGSRMAVQ
mgnify:CR=1 FL=1